MVIIHNKPLYILEKRRPDGRFFLGPAGSCLGYAQLLSFSILGMDASGAAPSPPPKSFFQSSKSLKHWRTEIVPESSIRVQNVPMDAKNNFSFGVSFRKCHLTHKDTTCPPSLALDHWRTGRVLERSLGVQDVHMDARNNFSFSVPFKKCH